MFLFTSDASILRPLSNKQQADLQQISGELFEIRANGAALIWMEDVFTVVGRCRNEIVIQIRRPEIDSEAICEIRWRPAKSVMVCRRRWSGEFGAYWSRQNGNRSCPSHTLISSHHKLTPLLLNEAPRIWKRIEPGQEVWLRAGEIQLTKQRCWATPFRMSYGETVREVRRLVLKSVSAIPAGSALLLSGGIDSSVVAAAMRLAGKEVNSFTFGLSRPVRTQQELESDLACARRVAAHLKVPLSEILLDPRSLIRSIPMGIYLAETPRGTIVDDCAALVQVAKEIASMGFSQVLMGEAADDLFGGFKFALRYYRGPQLRAYYRAQLTRNLPDELAIIQNVFAWFGISVIQPLWTAELLRIGYNLPLRFRLDRRRLMKQILRDAFASELPPEIVSRPKCVTRDSTQIRYVLEDEFGTDRDRYRPLFRIMMGSRAQWPKKFRQQLKSWKT
jgi:asparagine synthetase B (glutamine-hydrolysing)